jgi:hypothetical protein
MSAASSVAKAALILLFWAVTQLAWAAGKTVTVDSLTGTVSVQGADGTVRVIAQGASLQPGDILQTEQDSAVNLRFPDGGKIALRANSRFMIEDYRYDLLKPQEDSAIFRLLKGGMRTLTGLIGKRGNRDAYQNKTPTATIGIRGTDYALLLCAEADPACTNLVLPKYLLAGDGKPPSGLYLSVFEGVINAANNAGNKEFAAGKSGYVRDFNTLPVELEAEPGLAKEFMGFHGLFDLMSPLDASPEACLVK